MCRGGAVPGEEEEAAGEEKAETAGREGAQTETVVGAVTGNGRVGQVQKQRAHLPRDGGGEEGGSGASFPAGCRRGG